MQISCATQTITKNTTEQRYILNDVNGHIKITMK